MQVPAYYADTYEEQAHTRVAAIGEHDGTPWVAVEHCLFELSFRAKRAGQLTSKKLLAEGFSFYHDRWEPGACRFVTSFSTTEHDVDTLLEAVRRLAT